MLRLDRVGRGSIVDSMLVLKELGDLGVQVFTRDGGLETVDGPMKELITAAKFAVAGFENDVRREKSLAFHARKKAAGEYSGTIPYGFVLVEKRLTPYAPESAIVRALFEKRAAGWGYQRLAQYAASMAPAKIRPNGEFQKFSWGATTIVSILRNRKYREAIVTPALWDAVDGLRAKVIDRRASRWPWPLRGAIRCTCGAALLGEASGREKRRTRYYVCRRFNSHQDPRYPRYPHHHAAKMEAQFVALLSRLEAAPDLKAVARSTTPVAALRQRKADLTRERSGVDARRTKSWELAEDGAISKADLAARLEELRGESERIAGSLTDTERQLAAAEARERSSDDVAAAIAGLAGLWPKLNVAAQRDVARAVSVYLGGLWADPKRPGELYYKDDGSRRKVSISRMFSLRSSII